MTTGATNEPYAAANRLLFQLRTVARRLTAGLDARSLADALLRSLCDVAPYDRAAVLVAGRGGTLLPLAARGPDGAGTSIRWNVDLDADTPLAEAWLTQHAQARTGQHEVRGAPPRAGSGLAVPLRIGGRTLGLVVLETGRRRAYPERVVAAVEALTDDAVLPLDTALLFEEVRHLATTEERQRLAREIHDGIAQELASLGYTLDAVIADAQRGADGVPDALRQARADLSGILRDVRHSIHDLRSTVDEHGGLGAAVSDYARAAGTSAPFRVHLSLDEAPTRLPADTESELLRIAQEAITNARKHAAASNLWVTCRIDPPAVVLRVEDDGRGLRSGRRTGSYGLHIMRERAQRLGASLEVRERRPTGTLVEVALGTEPHRSGGARR